MSERTCATCANCNGRVCTVDGLIVGSHDAACEYYRGETRDYVPERTCHMEPDETASHAMCGPAVRCDACGAAVPAVGTLRYCPNCGAKVVEVVEE